MLSFRQYIHVFIPRFLRLFPCFLGRKFPCTYESCTYVAGRMAHHVAHTEAKHSTKPRYVCESCGSKHKTKSRLINHIRADHEGIRYPCKQCKYISKYKSDLKKHIMGRHKGGYRCDQCDHTSIYLADLKNHKLTRHEGKIYPCDACDYRAISSCNLKRHKDGQHMFKKFKCPQY